MVGWGRGVTPSHKLFYRIDFCGFRALESVWILTGGSLIFNFGSMGHYADWKLCLSQQQAEGLCGSLSEKVFLQRQLTENVESHVDRHWFTDIILGRALIDARLKPLHSFQRHDGPFADPCQWFSGSALCEKCWQVSLKVLDRRLDGKFGNKPFWSRKLMGPGCRTLCIQEWRHHPSWLLSDHSMARPGRSVALSIKWIISRTMEASNLRNAVWCCH